MNIQGVGVFAFIYSDDKNFLVVKRSSNDDFSPGFWELPGGGVEFNEKPEDAVIREVQEECGLEVQVLSPLKTMSYLMNEQKQVVEIIYLCQLEKSSEVILSFEHDDYKWINFHSLFEVKFSDLMRQSIKLLEHHPLLQ